jgi:hypothetical protein
MYTTIAVPIRKIFHIDSTHCSSNDPYDPNNLPYREVVGTLMYLAEFIRPDIYFALHEFSIFVNKPGKRHWHD